MLLSLHVIHRHYYRKDSLPNDRRQVWPRLAQRKQVVIAGDVARLTFRLTAGSIDVTAYGFTGYGRAILASHPEDTGSSPVGGSRGAELLSQGSASFCAES